MLDEIDRLGADDGRDLLDTADELAATFTGEQVDIFYEDLGGGVAGMCRRDPTMVDGSLSFHNNAPVLDGQRVAAGMQGDDEGIRTLYEELVHWQQIDDLRSTQYGIDEEDWLHLMPLHEAQASYNVDDGYEGEEDAVELYEEVLNCVDTSTNPLEAFSEDHYVGILEIDAVALDGPPISRVVTGDRDAYRSFDELEDEIYAEVQQELEAELDDHAVQEMDVRSRELDYRSDDVDADALYEHLTTVQREIDAGFKRAVEEDYPVPAGAPVADGGAW